MDYKFLLHNRKYIHDEICLIKPSSGHIRVCAIYANYYKTAMSSLGFHFLYESLNSFPQLSVERCYLPDDKNVKLVLSKYLSSYETATPLVNFNILAFSVSYEADFINALRILKLAKIPFDRSKRLEGGYPLIICGGPAAFQNMVPMYEIFDIIAVGAGEITIGGVISKYIRLAGQKKSAAEINLEIIESPGVESNFYAPALFSGRRNLITVKCAAPAAVKYAKTVILTPHTEFRSRALIEAVRGCPRRCKFCMVGNCYGRFNYNPVNEILRYIETIAPHTNKIGLLGPAVSAHPHLLQLYSGTCGKGFDISMSSIYLNEIGSDLIRLLSDNQQKNITVAVESASEDIRRMASKNLSDADIFENIDKAMHCGIKSFKVYFILGLYDYYGKNGGDEAAETVNFIERLNFHILKYRRDARLKISINPVVLKPRTALYDMRGAAEGFAEFYGSYGYILSLEGRYKQIVKSLKLSNIDFSEKNFADSALLKLINECSINLFDFFDDFFYNESKNSKAVIKIMQNMPHAFSAAEVKNNIFNIDFL